MKKRKLKGLELLALHKTVVSKLYGGITDDDEDDVEEDEDGVAASQTVVPARQRKK
ncbi:hypothetical protein [Kordia sp.]|uniref:hypothetical protein n=1 Tax=Kordia sp. TaxID=1965332 RepID=UPI003D6A268F